MGPGPPRLAPLEVEDAAGTTPRRGWAAQPPGDALDASDVVLQPSSGGMHSP